MTEPDYACALLRDGRGQVLLQLRPASARFASNQLTCFGGKREVGETAGECLGRELHEELGWRPPTIPPASVFLRRGPHLIASFHQLQLPPALTLVTEPGFIALAVPPGCLAALPLSGWHLQALNAWLHSAGQVSTVDLSD